MPLLDFTSLGKVFMSGRLGCAAEGVLICLAGCCREQSQEARRVLHRSIELFPCNWGAWRALQVSVSTTKGFASGISPSPVLSLCLFVC